MSSRTRTLRTAGTAALLAGGYQVCTGSRGVSGVRQPAALADEPGLDSELRFYGVWYAVSGLVMHKAAADPQVDRALHPLLAFGWGAAAVSRLLSARSVGRPPALFVVLAAAEAALAGSLLRSAPGRARRRP